VNIAVGLIERRPRIEVELEGAFADVSGSLLAPGRHVFEGEATLTPAGADASFALPDVTIGVGFHWERKERQLFRGALRILSRDGLTAVNDVPLEEYVTSVISSEMSAGCPPEFLKAHAVISRSWLWYPKAHPEHAGAGNHSSRAEGEVTRWYGRELHRDFDVCADDHCQRYQGITRALTPAAAEAVRATAGEMLRYEGKVCDARFSKCCGGVTEVYRSAWDDRDVPYLSSIADGDEPGHAWCDTRDRELLAQILPGFDQETRDFHRWKVVYRPEEIRELVLARQGVDLGEIVELTPLERGPSGRIVRLRIAGRLGALTVGKELEIRRTLSRSHLYSSAFRVERDGGAFVLHGSGWGHGVGLCQIGAAVMANRGRGYREILAHYYRGASI
jgi:SpoIID/LytB domain protein